MTEGSVDSSVSPGSAAPDASVESVIESAVQDQFGVFADEIVSEIEARVMGFDVDAKFDFFSALGHKLYMRWPEFLVDDNVDDEDDDDI